MPFTRTTGNTAAADDIRLQHDYQAQIYNAAWNGLLLGYPG